MFPLGIRWVGFSVGTVAQGDGGMATDAGAVDWGSSEVVLTVRSPSALDPRQIYVPLPNRLPIKATNLHIVRPGKEPRRRAHQFDTDPASDVEYVWDLSPKGTSIAILRYSSGPIYILPLDGRHAEEIAVKGWSSLLSLDWAPDGRSIYTSSHTKRGSILLRVDPKDSAPVLWEQNRSIAPWNRPAFVVMPSVPFAVPSQDGRHLAIYIWSFNANLWMLEDF
jgi:hypothetical protein